MRSEETRDVHEWFAILATIVLVVMAMFFGYSAAIQRKPATQRAGASTMSVQR
jgi:hypothetical protein